MRKMIVILFCVIMAWQCGYKKKEPLHEPFFRTAETIIDSVFQQDTDSLYPFAAAVRSIKYRQPFEVDSLLSGNSVYKKLDSMPEIHSSFKNDEDTAAKRSSAVDYYTTTRNVFEGHEHYSSSNARDLYDCRAYFQNDTLRISIGSHLGLGNSGLNIWIIRGCFVMMPYSSFCVTTNHSFEPLNVPLWQRLVLDKKIYSIGDSMYGYLSSGSVYYDVMGNPSGQKAKGFFKAVVKKRDW
ncbi:hypothetical protein LQ567_10520 [Niabella pedocola]|uniref:Lipoprotein n=1 Tax=Niabella pedocola TaxID=1752077 RepID=A0ABS8PQ45_9BACT|nr:hypothetical protein [Niabella pedocola]MCD2423194.1 hypothetical protein [Niabella pedocola]